MTNNKGTEIASVPFSISNFWSEDSRASAVASHGKLSEDTRHFLLHVSIR